MTSETVAYLARLPPNRLYQSLNLGSGFSRLLVAALGSSDDEDFGDRARQWLQLCI